MGEGFYSLREFYNLRKSGISEVIQIYPLTHSLAVELTLGDKNTEQASGDAPGGAVPAAPY